MTGRGGTDNAFQNALTYTCDLAAAREITVLIEPINLRDVAGYHLSTTDRAESNIDAVGKPNLKLMFDAWHLQVMKGDLINSVTRLLPKIEHTQIAGGPDSGESDQGEVDYAFPLKMSRISAGTRQSEPNSNRVVRAHQSGLAGCQISRRSPSHLRLTGR